MGEKAVSDVAVDPTQSFKTGFRSISVFGLTLSSSSPALMASSVGTPSSSSSAVPSIDLFTCFIRALEDKKRDKSRVNAAVAGTFSLLNI